MAKFVPRLEVFNNTLSPLVSRGQGLSFETLKLVAASFRESKGKSFDECWVHSAQDLLHWPAACSNIFLSYFEMFNRGVTKGDTATGILSETGKTCRFLVFLYAQLYVQGESNRDSQNSIAQERAFPNPEEKTPPNSPRRLVNNCVLLSPTTAKNRAVALDEQNEQEQVEFLKQNLSKIFSVLQEFVVLDQSTRTIFFTALEMIFDSVGGLFLDALASVYTESSSEPVNTLSTAVLMNLTQSEYNNFTPEPKKEQKIYGIHRSTRVNFLDVTKSGKPTNLLDLKIANCNNATIYMLQPFRFCQISSCADCTIVVGAVSNLISVENCERIKLIVCSLYVRVNNCLDCIFYTFTSNRPLLMGDNRGLVFGPYNTHYGMLEQHLNCAGLLENIGTFNTGSWDSPWDISIDESSAFSLIKPEDFFPFSVPIKGEAELHRTGTSNGIPLPMKYSKAIENKISNVNIVRDKIKCTPINEEGEKMLLGRDSKVEQIVQKKFRDWLVNSGNVREIADLICLEKACKKDES